MMDDPSETRPVRRGRRRRRGRALLAAFGVITLIVAGVLGFTVWRAGETPSAATIGAPITIDFPLPPPPASIATTAVEEIEVFAEPREDAELVTTLSSITEYGVARTLLVTGEQGDWVQALLPIRPNGATGWVRADDVTMSETGYRLTVSLSGRTITLTEDGTEVLSAGAAIGTSTTPTPPGLYYVTDPVDLRDTPGTGYGAYALGISGFSDVLTSFKGGPGQLAVHGTTNPSDLGREVSNGCVRVENDVILQIAELVPLGTPVEILA